MRIVESFLIVAIIVLFSAVLTRQAVLLDVVSGKKFNYGSASYYTLKLEP